MTGKGRMMKKHFVTFYSPGTFVAETTTKPVDSWNPEEAVEMARGISERHGATPYGFQFTTRSRGEDDLDSVECDRGVFYHLGGDVMTLAQVKAKNDPRDKILISNMNANGYSRIIVNCNSWKNTRPLEPTDVVLPFEVPQKVTT